MPPRKSRKVVDFTTETFAAFINEKMKGDDASKIELAELIVTQWGLALFELPKKEVTMVRDYLFTCPAHPIKAQLNAVVHSI